MLGITAKYKLGGHKESTRDLIKQRHHDVSRSNNPNALKWKFTSPNDEEIICHGNIEIPVSERNISMVQLKRYNLISYFI